MATMTSENMAYIFHHVFLPPELPGEGRDAGEAVKNHALLSRLRAAIVEFGDFVDDSETASLTEAVSAIKNLIALVDPAQSALEEQLQRQFQLLSIRGGIVPLHVAAQNAGLIVRRKGNKVIFETFELLPPNRIVMQTMGRITRVFPEKSVAIDKSTFDDAAFRKTLCHTVAKLSSQNAHEMLAKAQKAGKKAIEDRETTNPALVNEFLTAYLYAAGQPYQSPRLQKHTREEVMWSNARLPWHRSPMWLLARVALQTALMRTSSCTENDLYKEAMIFFMGQSLRDAVQAHDPDIKSDVLHCMMCKISRRITKLARTYGDDRLAARKWLPTVTDALATAEALLQKRMGSISKLSDPDVPMSPLSALDFAADVPAQLFKLDAYIDSILNPSDVTASSEFHPPPMVGKLPAGTLPTKVVPRDVSSKNKNHSLHHLAAFESWVEHHLADWNHQNLLQPDTCGRLQKLLSDYHTEASSQYGTNPENKSLMILTCLELWTACDKSATAILPLLAEYDPGIPIDMCQSLLLPLQSQMERLSHIEEYLEDRVRRAQPGRPCILSAFGEPESFAVRYFAQSPGHEQLHDEIVQHATADKEKKIREFHEMKEQYRTLMAEYNRMSCTYYRSTYDSDVREHDPYCHRCNRRDKANGLKIDVFEWPLPTATRDAQATVFELDRPKAFGNWRDATAFLLMDVFDFEYAGSRRADHEYKPSSCLSSYEKTTPQRIQLLSETKPAKVTHRSSYSISDATLQDVCVNNGLQYHYFDRTHDVFTATQVATDTVARMCMYKLPADMSVLEKFLWRPHWQPDGPDPNLVISSQSECPPVLSLDEFKALTSIPYGTRTQWSNLLVQLAMPSVDFKKIGTYIFILQTIHQAGPTFSSSTAKETTARAGHQDLLVSRFHRKLMDYLRAGLNRIRENWESYQALAGFIAIANRIGNVAVSFKSDKAFTEDCRQTALRWMHTLRDKARASTDSEQRTEFLEKAFELALIGASTFEYDESKLRRVLKKPQAAAALLEFYINIEETFHSGYKSNAAVLTMAYQRWVRLTSRALPILLDVIVVQSSTCLDNVIASVWASYQKGTPWRSCPDAEHWLTSELTTAGNGASPTQSVHFNLLTGELLVDGLPLSRLPADYESQTAYEQIFGKTTIEVMPSTRPGMKFSAIRKVMGHQAYFGLDDHKGLKLSIDKGTDTWDLIPRRVLWDQIPQHFLVNFTHWYHRNTKTVGFRPLNMPWVSSSSLWTLHPRGDAWTMEQKEQSLIFDRNSPTARELTRVFSPVEEIAYLHLIWDGQKQILKVALPRLKIQFSILPRTDKLVSRECRGMWLNPCNRIGTLVGLASKLILTNSAGKTVVLIPSGTVKWQRQHGHVRVTAVVGTCHMVHHYTVDDQIGRLLDSGSVQSKLYLCYLHALTSYCLPDALTSKTGTERALEILGETDIPSAARLTQENVVMLQKIAALAPQRCYYPRGSHLMQNVSWDKQLSFLSQHGELYRRARALLDDAARREFFHQGQDKLVGLDVFSGDDTSLLDRDAIRASTFYRADAGGDLFTVQHDGVYTGRLDDGLGLYARRDAAFFAASRLIHGTDTLQYTADSSLPDRLWKLFQKKDILGVDQTMTIAIEYDAELLEEGSDSIGPNWCLLHQAMREETATRFDFAVCIAALAFRKNVDLVAIQALCAMYTNAPVANVEIPHADSFRLSLGREVPRSRVEAIVKDHARAFEGSTERRLRAQPGETAHALAARRARAFTNNKDQASRLFVQEMVAQWPCPHPTSPEENSISGYISVGIAMGEIRAAFQLCWENRNFYLYLKKLSQAIADVPRHCMPAPVFVLLPPAAASSRPRAYTTTDDLFSFTAPTLVVSTEDEAATDSLGHVVPTLTDSPQLRDLSALSDRLASMVNQPFKEAYVADFRQSIDCIRTWNAGKTALPDARDKQHLCDKHAEAQRHRDSVLRELTQATTSCLPVYRRYNAPRASPLLFISQLAHKQWRHRSLEWRRAIVAFGCAMTAVQRAARLVAACDNSADLARELANRGHTNWDPLEAPETLLQETMSGILAREVQIDIAAKMAHPPAGRNAAMQLNMGEGKSSVIVPIVAASLADGSRLVVVIVGKPQSKQMLHMLVSKLGGLSGRRIYHMPFSRSLVLRKHDYSKINRMCHECRDAGGILLVQPEHLLSFQLAGPEKAISDQADLSTSALATRQFFLDYARYIVDESDENFSVKFELTYTMGTPSNVELSPERWVLIQAVLGLVRDVAPLVQQELPLSIEIEQGAVLGAFPRIRFLNDDGRDRVCQMVAARVCQNGLPGLPIGRQAPAVRDAIFRYITETQPSEDTVAAVESCEAFWTESVQPRLLLVRGLLGQGVLGFAFGSKRWRVNYGIDKSRRPPKRLAVPFRAKDSPAPQAEFSHPDVVIVLTCLSYYYGGLSHDDLFSSLETLLLSDQAPAEYNDWIRSASPDMSAAFQTLSGVNIKDRHQCKEQVFPHLQRSKGAIDYFLANIVFPKEMNEFPQKLSASGWDIGREQAQPTTGFSGTSDSQHLLPLAVDHLDLPGQRHTNALVLQHLLHPRNTVYYMPTGGQPLSATSETASNAEKLLRLIVDAEPPIQVILDAGAQILELTNIQMAKEWLVLDRGHKEAVVFCGANDDIMVIDRSGHAETLQTSPFAQQLDRCLVFLDEAHTRGIDLKLPQNYRAAVTLGANLTKDRLVQACMRMRRLDSGQSVCFFVPKEIQDKISPVESKTCTVADVLIWSISETWADLSRSMPLWAVQGARFVRQKQVWVETNTAGLTQACASKFLEKEAMLLADHYTPKRAVNPEVAAGATAAEYMRSVFGGADEALAQDTSPELEAIVQRCRQFDAHHHASASALHEEQERELAPEVEEEKQVERPPPLEPAKHSLHRDIEQFVATGKLPETSVSVSKAASRVAAGTISHIPAFWSLSQTSAAKHLDVAQFPRANSLLVSADFARTVQMPTWGDCNHSDSFLRPVQWILTRRINDARASIAEMMVISPYEAQHLLPAIKSGGAGVYLHLYAPRSSLSFAPIDHLQLYTVPQPAASLQFPALAYSFSSAFDHDATSSFSVQLNLFAGQLYFASMPEYKSACRYLGLASEASTDDSTIVSADGFILAGDGKSSHFKKSPAAFFGVYLPKIRWNCETISRTHWGRVFGGQFVTAEDIVGS